LRQQLKLWVSREIWRLVVLTDLKTFEAEALTLPASPILVVMQQKRHPSYWLPRRELM
jgi:hypothetical protein